MIITSSPPTPSAHTHTLSIGHSRTMPRVPKSSLIFKFASHRRSQVCTLLAQTTCSHSFHDHQLTLSAAHLALRISIILCGARRAQYSLFRTRFIIDNSVGKHFYISRSAASAVTRKPFAKSSKTSARNAHCISSRRSRWCCIGRTIESAPPTPTLIEAVSAARCASWSRR